MTCKNCGKHFLGRESNSKFCSKACYFAWQKSDNVGAKRRKTGEKHTADFNSPMYVNRYFREMKRIERLDADARKARMAARDAAYAAAFPNLASGANRGVIGGGSRVGTFGDAQNDAMRVFA